jgi:ABC-type amino acid transport substrate-binding protein
VLDFGDTAARAGRRVRAALLVCLVTSVLAGCAMHHEPVPAYEHEEVAHAPSLRVAVPSKSPPYAFRQRGELVGLEVDFAHELAAALGRPLELVELQWEDLIPAVRAHRVDIVMGGMTITPGRQVQISFSDPYLRSGLLTVMRRENVADFKSVGKVLQTTEPVGVISGTTAERFVREHAPNAAVTVYPDIQAAIDELRERRVTLVVHDAPVCIWYAGGDEANLGVLLELLDDEKLGWGIARDDQALHTSVNEVLAHWRADGTRDRILDHWIHYWQRLESKPVAQ